MSSQTTDKYRTKNPLYRFITQRFLNTLEGTVASLANAKSILDIGCGEGYVLNRLVKIREFARSEGVDISEESIKNAKASYPSLTFLTGSCYNLSYKNGEFDLVLACEVLEHLEDYGKALSEIRRVTNKYCILSVPLEPFWRICNLARGAYVPLLGNTPGHIQNWGKKAFAELIKKYFTVEKFHYPLPWQLTLCRKT